MDNKNELELLRTRSSSAVIRHGYRLFSGNFRKLLRSSWVAAAAYALIVSLASSYYISQLPAIVIASVANAQQPALSNQLTITGLLLALAGLLIYVATAVLSSYAVSAFAEHQASGSISSATRWYGRLDRKALWPTLRLYGWNLIVIVLMSVVMGGVIFMAQRYMGRWAGLGLLATATLIIVALTLPLTFTNMKYLLTPKASYLPMLAATYGKGLRHWGRIFIVMLVVGIVTYACILLTELPALILYLANTQSQIGRLQGDPVGMPDYMLWMNIVVFAIAGFIQAYIFLSTLYPAYYLYGSIETEEKERQTLTPNTQQP
jgi:hypothetical protein